MNKTVSSHAYSLPAHEYEDYCARLANRVTLWLLRNDAAFNSLQQDYNETLCNLHPYGPALTLDKWAHWMRHCHHYNPEIKPNPKG